MFKNLLISAALVFLVSSCGENENNTTQSTVTVKENVADRTLNEGIDFLLENSKKEGIITTASGLQYQIIVEGVGEHPKERDKVKVMYSGRTIDGNVFDRSKKPAVFPLDRVIKGISEGIMLLKPGAVAKLYIPSDLAYGKNSPVASIPPNSVLIFEVELIEIVKD